MNRNYYSFGIFISALAAILSFYSTFVYLRLGRETYQLQSFVNWYILVSIVSLGGALVILKYYHFKQYKITFWTGVVLAIISFVNVIITYGSLMG